MACNYSWLAKYYNRLMDHVSYESWAAFISQVLKARDTKPEFILELGAGTCQLAPLLSIPTIKRMICSDLSLSMLQQGTCVYPRVAMNATHIPLKDHSMDLVLMSYDAFNYLNPVEVRQALDSVHRVLKPGGVFLFDITTEHNSVTWFDAYHDVIQLSNGVLARSGWYEPARSLQHNRFDLFIEDKLSGLYQREVEHHVQQIYAAEQVETWLEECTFQVEATFDAFTLNPSDEESDRIHFLAVAQ